MVNPVCPKCGRELERVRQSPTSPLNAEQFDAVKAGDWYCSVCPGNGRGHASFCYFWDSEIVKLEPLDLA
jgi:hypothetical protein